MNYEKLATAGIAVLEEDFGAHLGSDYHMESFASIQTPSSCPQRRLPEEHRSGAAYLASAMNSCISPEAAYVL